ncbi:MAG: Xylose isomerase protein barrel [Phycisphaerales bacterium]|nr:Xylose isomerase protein barrel [Phycisphaerales bacterium]
MTTVPTQPVSPTRRGFLRGIGGALVVAAVAPAFAGENKATANRISIADRAVGQRQSLGSFAVAAAAGASALELDFGRLGSRPAMQTRLNSAAGRQQFVDAAQTAGIAISSLAFSAFTEQSFADHPKAVDYADDLIYTAGQMGVRICVLPIGLNDELADATLRERAVERLKLIAPLAQRAGVVLAVDAAMHAVEMNQLLNDVGSPTVQACVSADPFGGIGRAFGILGADRIAQIRFQFDDSTDQSAALSALHNVCTAAGWQGWTVIDRPATSAGDVLGDAGLAVRRLAGAFTTNYA